MKNMSAHQLKIAAHNTMGVALLLLSSAMVLQGSFKVTSDNENRGTETSLLALTISIMAAVEYLLSQNKDPLGKRYLPEESLGLATTLFMLGSLPGGLAKFPNDTSGLVIGVGGSLGLTAVNWAFKKANQNNFRKYEYRNIKAAINTYGLEISGIEINDSDINAVCTLRFKNSRDDKAVDSKKINSVARNIENRDMPSIYEVGVDVGGIMIEFKKGSNLHKSLLDAQKELAQKVR